MEVAVDASFAAYLIIYLVAGVPAVLRWGGDIGDPIDFNNSPRGVLVKLVLIYGTLLDFVLASTTVNRWVMRWKNPSFDYKWTWRNAVAWAKYSLPSSLLAVGMALFIPKVREIQRTSGNTYSSRKLPRVLFRCVTMVAQNMYTVNCIDTPFIYSS